MENQNNKSIIFLLPEGMSLVEATLGILKNNNLEESKKAELDKILNGKDYRLQIVIDTAKMIVRKEIDEEKAIDLLQKRLETTRETAEKIATEVKTKLTPYARIVPPKEVGTPEKVSSFEPSAQELILDKVKQYQAAQNPVELETPKKEMVKEVVVPNVEENAKVAEPTKRFSEETKKAIQEADRRKPIQGPSAVFGNQKSGPDQYREKIE